jgi:hypothetical protein
MPDLTLPLTKTQVLPGLQVDICPSSGSLANMSTLLVIAKVKEQQTEWESPPGFGTQKLSNTDNRILLEVTNVIAPSAMVPSIKMQVERELAWVILGLHHLPSCCP